MYSHEYFSGRSVTLTTPWCPRGHCAFWAWLRRYASLSSSGIGRPRKTSTLETFYLVRIVVRRVAGLSELAGEPVRIDECVLGRTPRHVQACRSEMDVLVVNDDRHFEGHE